MLEGEKVDVDPERYKRIDGVVNLFYNTFFTEGIRYLYTILPAGLYRIIELFSSFYDMDRSVSSLHFGSMQSAAKWAGKMANKKVGLP